MRKIVLSALLAFAFALTLGLAGCSGTSPRVVRKPDDMITTYSLDIQDWDAAADSIREEVLKSGKIQGAGGKPAVIWVGQFENRTGELTAPMHLLTQKIVQALTESGKAEAMADDPVAHDLYIKQQLLSGQATADPSYTLTGNITKLTATDGRDQQVTYVFNLNVNRASTGTVAWMSQFQFTKKGTRAGLGL